MRIALVRCRESDIRSEQAQNEEIILGYAFALLNEAGFESKIFDFCLDPSLPFLDVVKYQPGLVVIVLRRPAGDFEICHELISNIVTDNEFDSHITIIGRSINGIETILNQLSVDSFILGEEPVLIELANALEKGLPIASVPGLAYLDPQTQLIKINRQFKLIDLDKRPFPKRYFFEKLASEGKQTSGLKAIIETSRGCYANCDFCWLTAFKNSGISYSWRGRSPQSIIDEILYLISSYGIKDFLFYDANFFGPGIKGKKRGGQLAELVFKNSIDIRFSIYARSDDLDFDTIQILKNAGLVKIFLGIESLSQAVLNRYNKNNSVELNIHAINMCKDLDIYMHLSFITFDHFTSVEEVKENLTKLKDCMESKPYLFQSYDFLYNRLILLEDTTITNHYTQKRLVNNDYFSQKQLNRNYDISNPMVEFIANTSKILFRELQKILDETGEEICFYYDQIDNGNNERVLYQLQKLVDWRSNLPLDVICLVEQMINEIALLPNIKKYEPQSVVKKYIKLLHEI